MPKVGIFLNKDQWHEDTLRPQTLNGWNYVQGNPINLTDPSGLCSRLPQLGPSDCEKFVAEVQQIIERAKAGRAKAINDNNEHQAEFVVQMLAAYYAGFKLTTDWELFGRSLYIPNPIISYNNPPEHWSTPGGQDDVTIWDVFQEPPILEAEKLALQYGFKRIFYNNSHHYFANFYEAWFYGDTFARYHNGYREAGQLGRGENDYADSAADVLVVEMAIDHTNQTQGFFGDQIDLLPSLLRRDVCASSLQEIYAGWGPDNTTVLEWLGPPPTPEP